VTLSNQQKVGVDEVRIAQVAKRTAALYGAKGEISISIVDTARIADLNAQYMDQDGPTDVLSFPVDGLIDEDPKDDEPPPLIGEVVICPEYAINQQSEHDIDAELDLLIAHGVLHLLGLDHDTEANAQLMREAEVASVGRAGAQAG